MSELREDCSARTPNSAKCNGDSGLETRVNGCPVLLDFKKRVVNSSYTLKGSYRTNSPIKGDPQYRVIDKNTIDVEGKKGFSKLCQGEVS